MPELPDIEAYIAALTPRLVDRTVTGIRLASPFLLRTVTPPPAATTSAGTPPPARLRPEDQHCDFLPYAPAQIELLVTLLRDVLARHPDITPWNVVAHADIAPSRKGRSGPPVSVAATL